MLTKFSRTDIKRVSIIVFIIPFLMGLAVDLYVPSLPSITRYFHTHQGLVQYSISLYMLGYGLGQIFIGILSDCYGRRFLLKASGILFVIASLAIIFFAPNIIIFNVWRFLQGLSIAGLAVIARAMLVDVFSGRNLYIHTTYFSLSWSLGPILGPFIGGYLQHYFGWQADFIFFTIYGLVIIALCIVRFPETNQYIEERTLRTSVDNTVTVLSNPIFILTSIISSLVYGIFILFNTTGPFILQNTLKLTPVEYGNIALLLGVCYFAGTLSNRMLISKLGMNRMFTMGIRTVTAISILLIVLLFIFPLNIYIFIIPIAIMFYTIGFVSPNLFLKTMSLFQKQAGTASSVYGSINGIVVAIMAYLVGLFEIHSAIFIALSYVLIFVVSYLLAYIVKRLEHYTQSAN